MRSTKHQTCVKMSGGWMAWGGQLYIRDENLCIFLPPIPESESGSRTRSICAPMGRGTQMQGPLCGAACMQLTSIEQGMGVAWIAKQNVLQQISDASNCVVITYSTKLTYCRGNCMNFGQYLREWQMGRWRRTRCYSLHFTQEFQKGSGG